MSFFDSRWYFLLIIFGTVGLPLILTQCMGFKAVSDGGVQECGSGPFKYDC